MIYATDLDRTVIFSSKFFSPSEKNVTCVEYKGNKEISYMYNEALDLLYKFMEKKDLFLIPVTTRSLEQYQRVTPFQKCKYAIVANGGIMLYNGEVFKPWQEHIKEILCKYQEYDNDVVEKLQKYQDYFDSDIRKVDDIFYFVKLQDNDDRNEELLKYLDITIDKSLWNFTLQGLKLYIIPKEITKENALKFLKSYLNESFLITSGDGKLDKDFIMMGDIIFIPLCSEVLDYITLENKKYNMVSEGLKGTIELFKRVQKIYLNGGRYFEE